MAAGWHRRRIGEQHRSSGIQAIRTEDTTGGSEVQITTCELHVDLAQVLGACRGRSEVVIRPHTVSVPDTGG